MIMKIFFVADSLELSIPMYKLIKKVFDNEILVFAPKSIKSTLMEESTFKKVAIIEYDKTAYYAFNTVINATANNDGVLFVYATSNATQEMLLEMRGKMTDTNVVYCRKRPLGFFGKIARWFNNIFINLFIMHKDSCASNKCMYLSVEAIKCLPVEGTKYRFIILDNIIAEEVFYPAKIKETHTRPLFNNLLSYTTIALVVWIATFIALGVTLNLSAFLYVIFSIILSALVITELLFLYKSFLDRKIFI